MSINLKNEYRIILLVVFCLALCFSLYVPGFFTIDDVTYFLMSHSLTKYHSLSIWNGFDEFKTAYFGTFDPVYYKNKMYGKYPPLYPIISYPFYFIFGIKGLFYLNIIAFSMTIFVLYKFSILLFNDNSLSFLICLVYSFCTFSFEYAIGLWPHILSVSFVLSSYYCFEVSFKTDKSKLNSLFLLFSGFLIGISIGIRLQNIISVGIIGIITLIFSNERFKKLAYFLTGTLPAFLTIGYINYQRFGSIDPFSYGHYKGKNIKFYLNFPTYILLFASFFLIFYIIFYIKNNPTLLKKKYIKPVLSIISLSIIIILLADPKKVLFYFLKILYANLIDLSILFDQNLINGQRFDIFYYNHIKKSILQSCPFLILSFISPWIMQKKGFDKRKIFLLSSAFLIQLMFISAFYFHGGLSFNIRYALDFLPFAVILCCYAIKDIEFNKSHIILSAIFSIPFIIQNRFFLSQPLWKQLSILYIPLCIASVIILLFSLKTISKNKIIKYLFGLIVLFSFMYGMIMTFSEDLIASRKIRKQSQNVSEELNAKIKDNSFVFMEKDMTVAISAVKAWKRVRIALKGEIYKELINFYLNRKIPVYIISDNEDNFQVEKDFSNYSIRIIPAKYFLLYEILGFKNSKQI